MLKVALLVVTALLGCRAAAPLDKSDLAVRQRVEAALRAQQGLDARSISVDSQEGRVTVSGVVKTHEEKVLAGQVSRRVPGVEAVILNLIIQQ